MNPIGVLSSAAVVGTAMLLLSQAKTPDPSAVVESRHSYGFDAVLVVLLFAGALVAICRANRRG